MDDLLYQVRKVRRRLSFRRFLVALAWCWFAMLLVLAVAVGIDRFYPFRPAGVADWHLVAGAVGIGLLAALGWMFFTRENLLQAAIDLDRRFELKERVSSTLALPEQDRNSEIGQALVADAQRKVERIDVAGRFGVSPGKQFLLPLAPALAVLLLILYVAPAEVQGTPTQDPAAVKKQVKKSTEVLRRKMIERRKKAEEQGLKEAERLFRKLEQAVKDINDGKTDRKKALVQLNDYARQLKERRKKVGGADEVRKELSKLKKMNTGPAAQLAQALANGDYGKAASELEKLKNKIENSDLDDEQKKKLTEQLEQIKDKLKDMADKQKDEAESLKQQSEQMRQDGQPDQADQLNDQLDKLLQQAPQMNKLADLAKQLGDCSNCLKQGNAGDAAQAMQNMQQNLNALQQQLDEAQMLDDAMQQLGQARDQMNCKQCGGSGCQACGGQGNQPGGGQPGQGNQPGSQPGLAQGGQGEGDKPGDGMGAGQGHGFRPEADSDTGTYDTRVRQQLGPGAADIESTVSGPNRRGNVMEYIEQENVRAKTGETDPLTGQEIPRRHRQHAREYFERLRKGE